MTASSSSTGAVMPYLARQSAIVSRVLMPT
ncbi:hypothetical protein RKD26_005963 [Streptomyces calvus]